MIRSALQTVGAAVIATAVVAWALVGRRDIKPENARRPRTGPVR